MRVFAFAIILMLFALQPAFSQVNVRDSSVFSPLLEGMYSLQIPGGDLADRFGIHSTVGAGLLIKTKSNWLFGANSTFIFGQSVKESDVYGPLLTSGDKIIDRNGEFADILTWHRGYSVYGRFGKLIPAFGPNPNSGPVALVGVGFLQHKIRLQNSNGNTVPLIEGDNIKGFDRLSNGLSVTQFLGYYYLGNKRLVNFFGGFEFSQSFTKNRRSIDFATLEQDTKDRLDLTYGIRVGWIIPFYARVPRDFYYE